MIHKNKDGLPLYILDRSRLDKAKECPRAYYWLYGFMGIGIVKNKDIPPYWPFSTGNFIHEGVEMVLKGIGGKEAAEIAACAYMDKFLPIISDPDINPELQARLYMELHQEVDLVRGLVYGWSLVGLPRMLALYAVVEEGIEQEEEISWMLSGNPNTPSNQVEMRLLTRTDILCRSKMGGGAILFNLKSVGNPNEKWRVSFNRDMQTITEAIAVEDRLGIKVDGVIIEGLVKGTRKEWPRGSGFWQYDNSLIYVWVKDSTEVSLPGEEGGGIEFATSWDYTCTQPHVFGNNRRCPGGKSHTLGKGYRKRPVRDAFPNGVYAWVDYLMRNDPSVLEAYFIQLPAISRDEFQVERWKRQHLHREKERQDSALVVDSLFVEGDKEGAYLMLDHSFPFHEGYQCHSCAYNSLCWEAGDPVDESVWRARVPNHPLEGEMLVRIE